jgi:hypothetical protein
LALQFQQQQHQKQNTNIYHNQDPIENNLTNDINKSSSNYFLQHQQQQEFFPLKNTGTTNGNTRCNGQVAQDNNNNNNNDLKGKHLNTNANILPPHIAMLLIDKLQQQLLEATASVSASSSSTTTKTHHQKQLNANKHQNAILTKDLLQDECNEDEERLASVNEDEDE